MRACVVCVAVCCSVLQRVAGINNDGQESVSVAFPFSLSLSHTLSPPPPPPPSLSGCLSRDSGF